MAFQNRTAVITGAAGRIGSAAAREFARRGVKLFLTDIDTEKLQLLTAELQAMNAVAHSFYMDVSKSESIQDASEEILRLAGRVDILVNNAGLWPRGSALECSLEDFQKILNLNLNSVFQLSRIFGEKMKNQSYGRIINLGSIAGEVGLPGMCAYSVAKAGVIMLTKTMAMELAKYSVTVNCVSPGMIQDESRPHTGTWLGRSGIGSEVARAIVFLADDDAGYITGVDLPVDGGRILGPLNVTFKG